MPKNIALIAGGYSGEYVISVQSAATIEHNINKEHYRIYKIIISREGWYYLTDDGQRVAVDKNDFSLMLPGGKVRFDAVFIGIHGTPGEDGRLQGYFDMLQIPYTGCGVITSAITFNKSYCNKIVAALGIVQVSCSVHLFRGRPYDAAAILEKVGLPCFVKPNEGGSSIGMSKVQLAEEMEGALEKAFREDTQVLVEAFVKGRELTCGLFRTKDGMTILPVTEVISGKEFFDFEAKYTPGMSREITPAVIDDSVREEVGRTAAAIYDALNCRGIVRMDFILEEDSRRLYFLEANTMPGQSENSIVPQQVRAAGMTLQEFYGALLEECLRSHEAA
jgi:D-alanine-D-alanine ligase